MSIHFSSNSDEWATPQEFFNKYNNIYNFTLDAAASNLNYKVNKYYTIEDNALIKDWSTEVVWCNPPYSKLKNWIKKSYEESLLGAIVVMLIPARTDTIAWHEYIFPYAQIRFIKGRLKFGDSKNSAPFPSAIVIFNKRQIK
jgi:phage N-6-adenine-methyltransferase